MSDSDSDDFQDAREHIAVPPARMDKQLATTLKDAHEILANLDNSFAADLALHLYMVRLLETRGWYVANGRFSAWPLARDVVPVPRASREYVDECNVTADRQSALLVPYKQLNNDAKEKPKEQFLEYKPARTNAVEELELQLRAVFQRKIDSKIHSYNLSNAATRIADKTAPMEKYMPILEPPVDMEPETKSDLLARINTVFDGLIRQRKDSLVSETVSPFDWTSIALQAKDYDAYIDMARLMKLKYPPLSRKIFDQTLTHNQQQQREKQWVQQSREHERKKAFKRLLIKKRARLEVRKNRVWTAKKQLGERPMRRV